MNIEQLIVMLENKISYHRNMIARFVESGDLEAVNNIESDITQCQETLDKLKTLI